MSTEPPQPDQTQAAELKAMLRDVMREVLQELLPKEPAITPALLTANQAAEYLGVGRSKVWKLVGTKSIRCTRVGRCVRIKRTELDRYIDANTGRPERRARSGREQFGPTAPTETNGQ